MKRVTKKIWAAILTVLMLMNYIPIVVTAAEIVNSEERGNVSISLESTASKYLAEEYVYVDLKINSITKANKIAQFSGFIEYSEQNLQLEEITISEELASKGYSANRSSVATKKIFIENTSGNATLDAGDIICTIKFKALKSSDYETEIKVYSIDASDSEDQQISSESFEYYEETDIYINEPTITLPVERATLAHNLKITKTDESENAITKNSALFKITKLDGEVVYQETDENGDITIASLEMPTTESPYIYTIEEILAPEGYIKAEKPIQVTVTFDEEGNIQTALSNENGVASVISENNTIDLKVVNKEKKPEVEKELFNLVINKVDEKNNNITTSSAEIALTMPDGTKENYTTNSEGKTQNIAILAPEKAGTYTYLIKETKAPEGYIAEENNIIVELTYEKQANKIVLASGKVVSYNDEAITIEDGTVRTAIVNIKNEKQLVTYNYTINIDKTDTANNNITTSNAVFEISKDGKSEYIVTNEEGKAVYNFSMTNKEIVEGQEYTCTLKEIKAPDEYILDETTKTIKLTFNSDGTINTASINENSTEHTTNEVNIKVVNEKEPKIIPPVPEDFNLVVNKVDESGQIITEGTTYTVTLPSGEQTQYVTIGNNEKISAPEKAGTYVYVLEETTTPSGYIKGDDIVLKLTFEEIDGKIILVSGDNGVNVTEEENVKVATLNVVTKEEIITHNYTLNIDKVKNDTFKTNITEDSAMFEITANGQTSYIKTNQLGKATYDFSMTNKEIIAGQEYTYEVKEVKAPNRYILDETVKTITITFNSDGSINTAEVNGTKIEKINTTTNAVSVRIINEEKQQEIVAPTPEDFKLVINKVDEEGKTITDETKYKITLPNGTQVDYSTTGNNENLVSTEKAGTYVYVLTESVTPAGYVKGNDIILKLTFEEVDGKIVLVSGNNGVNVAEEENVKVATLDIETIKNTVTYNYSINIDKVNEENQNIESADTMFELTADGEVHYLKTDEHGKATYEFSKTNKNIVPGQEYTFTLKEIKAPNEYILDETIKTITITFNENGTINTCAVNGNNIVKAGNETNQVNVKITNEKEPVIVVPEGQDFDLIINKVDENNNLITADTANFLLTSTDGTRNTLATVNGVTPRVTIKAPNTAGKQIYFIQETKAPNGYDILNESLVIEANFIETEGKIVLSNAKVKEYNQEITPSNNTLTISVTNTKHEDEEQPENYTIKISGVDRENNPIENGTTVIKLTDKATGVYEYKEVSIKDGVIELELPKVEGTNNYELEQIKAPDGYELNSKPAQIIITFGKDENDKIEITNYTVTGEDTNKAVTTEKNTVGIAITNSKIKEEPQKQNYSIEINKLDSVTNELISQGSAIFTVVDSNGITKEYATTSGKITISDIIPGNVGENHIFVIKEKVAPEGYKLTSESIIMKVSFEKVEEKIVITNPELIMGNKIATLSKTENGNIKIDITNEKEQDDEELYVISKKDTAGINIYNLFTSYTGRQYTINEPFIDTKEAKYGGNVTVQEFINNLESNGVLTILDEEGNLIPNGNRVKTGMILKATKGKQEKTFKIVVKGDSNKDGRVTTVDINMLEKHLTGEKTVTDPIILRSLDLGNNTGDGRITTVDVNKFYTVQTK